MGSSQNTSHSGTYEGRSAFDADGVPRGEPRPDHFREILPQIAALRGRIERSMPSACGQSHEERIAASFTKEEWIAIRTHGDIVKANDSVVCPRGVRDNNPNCAHVTSNYQPDPYSSVIRRLAKFGVLEEIPPDDESSWGRLIFDLEIGVSGVEETIAAQRWTSLPIVGEAAKALQQPNVKRLLEVRSRLLSILDTVLADTPYAVSDLSVAAESAFVGIPAPMTSR